MSTIARRITAVVAAGLLTAALATTPASALRLVPPDFPRDLPIAEPSEDPSMLVATGLAGLGVLLALAGYFARRPTEEADTKAEASVD